MLGKLSQFFNFPLPCQPVSTYVGFLPPNLLLLCLFVCLFIVFVYLFIVFVCYVYVNFVKNQISLQPDKKKLANNFLCVCVRARVYHISLFYKDSKFTELFH